MSSAGSDFPVSEAAADGIACLFGRSRWRGVVAAPTSTKFLEVVFASHTHTLTLAFARVRAKARGSALMAVTSDKYPTQLQPEIWCRARFAIS